MRPRFRMGHLTREAAVVPREAGHLPRESAKQAVSANLGVPGAGGCLPGARRRRAAAADVAARRHEMERASSAGRDKGVHGRHCLAGGRSQRDNRVHARHCFSSLPQRNIRVHARLCFTATSAPPPLLLPAATAPPLATAATHPPPRRPPCPDAPPRLRRSRGFAPPHPSTNTPPGQGNMTCARSSG